MREIKVGDLVSLKFPNNSGLPRTLERNLYKVVDVDIIYDGRIVIKIKNKKLGAFSAWSTDIIPTERILNV